jgi:hypothetical protein
MREDAEDLRFLLHEEAEDARAEAREKAKDERASRRKPSVIQDNRQIHIHRS